MGKVMNTICLESLKREEKRTCRKTDCALFVQPELGPYRISLNSHRCRYNANCTAQTTWVLEGRQDESLPFGLLCCWREDRAKYLPSSDHLDLKSEIENVIGSPYFAVHFTLMFMRKYIWSLTKRLLNYLHDFISF